MASGAGKTFSRPTENTWFSLFILIGHIYLLLQQFKQNSTIMDKPLDFFIESPTSSARVGAAARIYWPMGQWGQAHSQEFHRGEPEFYPGTLLGEVHSPDPHHLPFPPKFERWVGLDNTMEEL